MIRACIFDLDGVVVYTDHFHFLAWKSLSDAHGWRFSESLNNRLRGVSRLDSLQIILDENSVILTAEEKTILANRKNDEYRELLGTIDESSLVPGAIPFITGLRTRGIRIGLGSSSKNADTVLSALGITGLFDAIVTGNDIEHSKPHPQIFQVAARRLDVTPSECVVFEDAESGIEAALAAGMVAVGFGDETALGNAHLVVGDYADVDVESLFARNSSNATNSPS